MGFFDELKKEISQAVTELVSDEEMLQEEISTDDTPVEAQGEDNKEYLDEDDYIETEDDYVQDKEDLGVVVDDYASDEYVNTLDIDISDLVKSYSNELNEAADGNAGFHDDTYADIPADGYGGQVMYPENTGAAYNEYYNGNYNENYSEKYNEDPVESNDDVMVNTLGEDFSNQDVFKVIQKNPDETETALTETALEILNEADAGTDESNGRTEATGTDVSVEEPEKDAIREESVKEESAKEESVKGEPAKEESVKEEPVKEKSVKEDVVKKETTKKVTAEEVTVKEDVTGEETAGSVIKKERAAEKKAEAVRKESMDLTDKIVIPHLEEEKVEEKVEEIKEEKKMDLQPDVQEDGDASETTDYSDETAVITKGLTVKGDLEAEGSINIFGTVEGNIKCKGKMAVSGTIYGNSETGELFANNAHINGNIVSRGSVKIGQGSIIIGNVTGTSAVIAGAVKGDIDVKGPVVVDSSAIVMGDIKSRSVQINIGAAIEGRCSQCYADVSPTAFFKES